MKKIVGISFGSSKRNKKVNIHVAGQDFEISRIGTDGSKEAARKLYIDYDGIANAIGIGGTDLYFYVKDRFYVMKDTAKLIESVKHSAVVDGIGIKLTREAEMPFWLEEQGLKVKGKKVFFTSAVDRYAMANSFSKLCDVIYGDFMFNLNLPIALKSLKEVGYAARILLPFITKMPIEYVYPIGKEQEKSKPKYEKFFKKADIIAGDFHLIKKYMPNELEGKIIVTNTTTEDDIKALKEKGVKAVATSTPVIDGRTFGTNVLEAVVVSLLGRKRGEESPSLNYADYYEILKKPELQPSLRYLNEV